MNLNTFFQISVSVFCIVTTLFILALFIWFIVIRTRLNGLIRELKEILEIFRTTAGKTSEFVGQSIESLEIFKKNVFTFEFVRRAVVGIIGLIKNNSKGTKDGKAK